MSNYVKKIILYCLNTFLVLIQKIFLIIIHMYFEKLLQVIKPQKLTT